MQPDGKPVMVGRPVDASSMPQPPAFSRFIVRLQGPCAASFSQSCPQPRSL